MDQRLLAPLDSGQMVLTAQRRQARQIRFRYATQKQKDQVAAWETPQVLGWDDWLKRVNAEIMWSGYSGPRNQRKLLSSSQEHVLWERVIRDGQGPAPDDLAGAARKARQAWTLIQAYRLPDPGTATFANRDVMAFSDWMRRYHAHCAERGLIDHARLADTIGPALRAGAVEMPTEIQLAGFDELTPQQRVLLKTLESLGTRLGRVEGPRIESNAGRVQCKDAVAEYTAAARWVRDLLDSEEECHIAVLVPELASDRKIIERIFDDILLPGSTLPSSSFGGRPYNVSVGARFDHHPLVVHALIICELAIGQMDFSTLSSLLRSPFSRAAGPEQPMRARFEVWLRDRKCTTLRSDQLLPLLREFGVRARLPADHLVLEAMLTGLGPLLGHVHTDARASQWATLYKQLLDVWGWPGDTALHSGEFQTAERFRSLLDELAGLDFLCGPLSGGAALSLLRRLCSEITFQPQTPELAVDILLPEQAYGLEFERIWVCGWHAEAWPRSPDPNPFVPIEWQRQYQIARGTPEAELEFAKRLTRRLLRGAPEVVISAPEMVEDRPVAVSPLVKVVSTQDLASLRLADVTDYRAIIRDATELETFSDNAGPPLEGIDRVGGGSRIFMLQSQCPFRAFAEMRLGARALNEPAPGLDPIARGNLVHKCLEGIWRRLNGWDMLQELINGDYLEKQIWEVVDDALSAAQRNGETALSPRFREIEHQRLSRLINAWLFVETERPPFKVASMEVEQTVRVGPLEIRARADRTDELPDGRIVMIDYKSGQPRSADWFDSRPAEPQMPLYAIAEDGEVAAVMFGRVRANDCGFVGVSETDDVIPGTRAFESTRPATDRNLDWPGLFLEWERVLESLAEQYVAGDARVDPRANACTYCHLASFCRINDRVAAGDDQ